VSGKAVRTSRAVVIETRQVCPASLDRVSLPDEPSFTSAPSSGSLSPDSPTLPHWALIRG
jgi:hypothetical protein